MAVRARTDNLESLRKRSGGSDGSRAFQDGTQGIDLSEGPMGEVGEGAVVDLAVEAEGFAEEDGGRGVAVGDGSHVHAYIIHLFARKNKHKIATYMTTAKQVNSANHIKTVMLSVLGLGTSG